MKYVKQINGLSMYPSRLILLASATLSLLILLRRTVFLLRAGSVFLLIFAIAPKVVAFDWSPYDTGGRSLGMGGAWLAAGQGSGVVRGNPALLPHHVYGEMSIGLFIAREDTETWNLLTGVPSSSSYDSYAYLHHAGALIRTGPTTHPVGLALNLQKMVHPGIASEHEDQTGGPLNGCAGIGVVLWRGLSAGGSFFLIGGQMSPSDGRSQQDYSGQGSLFGLLIPLELLLPNIPVTLAGTYHSPYTYSIESKSGSIIKYHYPSAYGGGFAWKPFKWLEIVADAEYWLAREQLSGVTNEPGDQISLLISSNRNLWSLRGGMEVSIPIPGGIWQFRTGIARNPTLGNASLETPYLQLKNRRKQQELGWSCSVGLEFISASLDLAFHQRFSDQEMELLPSPGVAWLIPHLKEKRSLTSNMVMATITRRFTYTTL